MTDSLHSARLSRALTLLLLAPLASFVAAGCTAGFYSSSLTENGRLLAIAEQRYDVAQDKMRNAEAVLGESEQLRRTGESYIQQSDQQLAVGTELMVQARDELWAAQRALDAARRRAEVENVRASLP